jgi:hypothetical protein
MAASGKNNTQRIETLEDRAANMEAQLRVHDTQIDGIVEVQTKGATSTEGHTKQITIIEQQILVLGDLKTALTAITELQRDLALLKKDIDNLKSWKDEQKKQQDESARRLWAFGPNITAGILTVVLTLAMNLFFRWYDTHK